MTSERENAQFIEKLEDRLTRPLPGVSAQNRMAPSSRKSLSYYTGEIKSVRMSSVMILLFREGDNWKFPLIRRVQYPGVHSGQMALPGGRMEKGDKDRIFTAIRETQEETGADLKGVRILGTLTELPVYASRSSVLPVVGAVPVVPSLKRDPKEVESLHIASLEELLDEKNRRITTLQVSDTRSVEAPYYAVDDQIVWGATAMILSEFLYIIREIMDH